VEQIKRRLSQDMWAHRTGKTSMVSPANPNRLRTATLVIHTPGEIKEVNISGTMSVLD
jgi:hypothetical protein